MGILGEVLLLLVSFGVILLGAELFTNAIEWFGRKHGLGQGMVGSVLAAVGTALPETMIPIVAIIFVGNEVADQVGIGAILGAPFMLSTAAMFVTGVAVLAFARGGRRMRTLSIDQRIIGRDLRFFLGMYIVVIGLGLPFFEKPFWLRVAAGVALVGAYVFYVWRTSQDPRGEHEAEEELNSLRLQPNLT
ncbi:MAG: sodium:calcium antiporter, partial [Pseudomonadota bacterium]|nr:sodium:calcium antiporter [Pseudomonadota bacterium]